MNMTQAENLFRLLDTGSFDQFCKAAEQSPALRVVYDRYGDFLLHRAAFNGSLAICKYLLRKGLSPTCPGCSGVTPLHYAAAQGDTVIMKLLLQAAGSQHSPITAKGITPLHVAAGEGHLRIVKMLISKGADSCAQDQFGRLPLHYAAGTDQVEVVAWLARLNSGLINQPDAFGQRPIHWAAQYACVRTANWLTSRCKVGLTAKDIYGRSPLFFLRRLDTLAPLALPTAIQLAIEFKGKSTVAFTPLWRAILDGEIKKVKRLAPDAASLNRHDKLGRTALHLAAMMANDDLYCWMKKKGADTKIHDDYGWRPGELLSYRLVALSHKKDEPE